MFSAMADTANQENTKPGSLKRPKKSSQEVSSGEDEHFRIIRKLAEGAYGKVLLVTDKRNTNLRAAMKVMRLNHSTIAERECKKERAMHQTLSNAGNHPNIVHFIGYRVDGNLMRLFIEYAEGGELFQQIEPEKGVESTWKARYYFNQLMEGIKFIHQQGICHRDIKPENLFLTKSDVLKIGDFGLATLFYYDGKERPLSMPCGTRPYASPELMNKSYRAQPADVWSCGIVLVAMLSGELPWQVPDREEESFRAWIDGEIGVEKKAPWNKMERQALLLVKWILNDNEKTRATVDQILTHPWCTARDRPNAKRHKSNHYDSLVGLSQPLPSYRGIAPTAESRISFSQSVTIESLLLPDSQKSQSRRLVGWDTLSTLMRRMTRFFVNTDVDLTTQKMLSVCQSHGVTVRFKTPTEMVGTQRDVSFVVTIYEMSKIDDDELVMVDFRRSRGDGLDFKRLFNRLRADFHPTICELDTNWLESLGLPRSEMLPPC